MRLDAKFYDLTQSLGGAFFAAVAAVRSRSGEEVQPQSPSPLLQIQPGRAESPGWFLVQAAEFDPEPLTVSNLRVRDIYASTRMVAALLELMAANNWLDRRGEAYFLTVEGRSFIQERREIRDQWMATLDPLLKADIALLEALLSRVMEASMSSDDPPGTWCLAHSRNKAPDEEAPIPVKLLQHIGDINAFRDDAHMAAWRPHGLEGYVWEAFSLVAAGTADNAGALWEALSYRGYSRGEYAEALMELAERGWLDASSSPSFAVAEPGRAIHEAGEQLTDQYFYTPWRTALSQSEITAAADLMIQLREELNGMA